MVTVVAAHRSRLAPFRGLRLLTRGLNPGRRLSAAAFIDRPRTDPTTVPTTPVQRVKDHEPRADAEGGSARGNRRQPASLQWSINSSNAIISGRRLSTDTFIGRTHVSDGSARTTGVFLQLPTIMPAALSMRISDCQVCLSDRIRL